MLGFEFRSRSGLVALGCFWVCAVAGCVDWEGLRHRNPPTVDPDSKKQTCTEPGDCTAPDACQLQDGVTCTDGFCVYPALTCTTPPQNECSADDATYRAFPTQGACDASTGTCLYTPTELACEGCQNHCAAACANQVCNEFHAGCRSGGTCVPGSPPRCQYSQTPDGTPCTDNDPCTHEERCLSSECISTRILDGSPCQGKPGVCLAGACVECTRSEHCDDHNECTLDSCGSNHCVHQPRPSESCNDGNACTSQDTCTASAQCVGTPVVCNAKSQCHDVGVCDPNTGVCSEPLKPVGANCDDGSACSHSDQCQTNGLCRGVAISCTSEPGPCGLIRTCNGTSACSTTYPGTNVGCSDGNACTHTDHCNGAGQCTGTSYACFGSVCMSSQCNGAGGCTTVPQNVGEQCNNCGTCSSAGTCEGGCPVGTRCCEIGICRPAHQQCP